MKITCRSDADAETLKCDIQSNQTLNKFLSFVGKSTHLQKAILLGISKIINSDYISDALDDYHNLTPDEFSTKKFYQDFKISKNEYLSLLKVIIKDGSLFIGPK